MSSFCVLESRAEDLNLLASEYREDKASRLMADEVAEPWLLRWFKASGAIDGENDPYRDLSNRALQIQCCPTAFNAIALTLSLDSLLLP